MTHARGNLKRGSKLVVYTFQTWLEIHYQSLNADSDSETSFSPEYAGRFTVPVLWDKKTETVVNNESSEIIRMFYSEFDSLLPVELREESKAGGGFCPEHLRTEIDAMNEWVYDTINNGVYKTGFAANQQAYESNLYPLFASLDRLEDWLGDKEHQPYLFGEFITEADVRLYTTLIRFDVAYYNIFMCNLKMIRYDYPRLSRWLRNLYWDGGKTLRGEAWKETVYFGTVGLPLLYNSMTDRSRMLRTGVADSGYSTSMGIRKQKDHRSRMISS